MTGQTNTDGSLGAQRKGTIVVTYPSGATCTVTNGSQTYTALDTSGAAAFVVESGTWTVKAVTGANTAKETVVISGRQIANVELSYALWLYDSGNQFENMTGGWVSRGKLMNDSWYTNVNFSFANNSMVMSTDVSSASGSVSTSNKIAVSRYSKLCAEVNYTGGTNDEAYLWLTSATSYLHSATHAASASVVAPYNGVIELDISKITSGNYYVALGAHANINPGVDFTVKKVWAE